MKKLRNRVKIKNLKQQRRSTRIKNKATINSTRPRLAVYRSNNYIYAQIIDDKKSHTLVSASDLKINEWTKADRAKKVWTLIAENAQKAWVTKVSFDRNWYRYSWRVKILAETAREGWLDF